MAARGVRRVVAAAGGALLLSATLGSTLTGCAGGPPTIPPSGVDGLSVPTPSAQASDFVATVDNPWLPLAVGSRWTYRSTRDAGAGDTEGTVEAGVPGRTRVVAGVTCTGLHTVARDARGRTVSDTWRWYAQDRDGNVWLFGEQGAGSHSWLAGEHGAQAGLAMAAHPRRGDGYAVAHAPGVAEVRATVLSLDEERTVPAGRFSDLVEIEETSALTSDARLDYYARGTGLVYREAVTFGAGGQVLVSYGSG